MKINSRTDPRGVLGDMVRFTHNVIIIFLRNRGDIRIFMIFFIIIYFTIFFFSFFFSLSSRAIKTYVTPFRRLVYARGEESIRFVRYSPVRLAKWLFRVMTNRRNNMENSYCTQTRPRPNVRLIDAATALP